MSNVSVIHLTVDCHVWTVCSDSFDNTDTSDPIKVYNIVTIGLFRYQG